MKEKILEIINSLEYKKASLNYIKNALGNPKGVGRILDNLVKEGILTINSSKEYMLCSFYHLIPCLITYANSKGMEATSLLDQTIKYFIPVEYSLGAIYNDKVLVGFRRNNAFIENIIKEYDDVIVGNVKNGKYGQYIIPINENYPLIDIEGKYEIDSVVAINIVEREPRLIGLVSEVLGNQHSSSTRIKGLARDSKVNLRFDEEVLKEANDLVNEDINDELEYRKDLTNELFVTIDGKDAKDLDDSICVSKNKDTYNLKVSIADVSHYVRKYSKIDSEALKRGTSIYLTSFVIPMLPFELSNNLCSLNPNELKLTMTVDMDIDKDGNVINYDIYESYIKSKYRLNYDDVNSYFNNSYSFDSKLNEMLDNALELSNIIKLNKIKRGEIELNIEEPELILNEKEEVIDVRKRNHDKAERLIEDFMIVANETVANHFFYLDLPFIYRIHEKPTSSKHDNFASLVHSLGYNLVCNENEIYPLSYQNVLNKISDEKIKKIVSIYMLRAMSKAKYSSSNLGHFGLASSCYTHFTSPIRRYPDLLVHRLIKMYIHQEKYNRNNLIDEISYIAELSSDNEIKALDLERKVVDIKIAEYMSNKLGSLYQGYISSVTEFGLFITLDNLVEGLVKYNTMDDFYIYDEINNKAIGQRHHNEYKMGDIVKVKLINVNIYKGNIDFKICKE